jgi:hypothetical protein
MDAGWKFTPPAGTTLDGFEILRVAHRPGIPFGAVTGYVASLGTWPPADLDRDADEQCVMALPGTPCDTESAGVSAYERSGLRASRLTLGVGCWNLFAQPDPTCYATGAAPPDLTIAAAKLTLRDDSPPSVHVELAEGSAVGGVVDVPAAAADEGAGLMEMSLLLDGAELAHLPASCHEPYVDPAPCPARRELSVPLDSRAFADGRHVVQVAAVDAAGNRSLSAPVSLLVANAAAVRSLAPGPNGRAATRFARLRAWLAGRSRHTDRTLAYGASTSADGQLTTRDGTPIRGAMLRVEQRAIGVASRPTQVATVTTDAAGRFSYHVTRGASRSLRFSYTAFPGDAGPVASAQVSVHVRAGVSLRASPARVRNGTVLTFRGRVLGEGSTRRPVVTIYALSRGGPRPRIPVETVRAAASGRFTYRYRFQSIPGPVTYRFEARVLKQTGFPYVEGASRPVAVHGRP